MSPAIEEWFVLYRSVDGTVRRYDLRFGKLYCDTIASKHQREGVLLVYTLNTRGRGIHMYILVHEGIPHIMLCYILRSHNFLFLDPVTCVSFSRDGNCVLISSLDETLRLLDKDTGEMLNRCVCVCVCV